MFKLLPAPPIVEGPIRVHECTARDQELAKSRMRFERSALPLPDGTPRRPRMRLCVEILCDWSHQRRYHRLPGTAVLMDAESPEQLMLVWQMLAALLRQIDGKYMAGPPAEP